jgi:UDP-2,4-diacetamido-2,4,6-trideoxy-beta-L-altropyranose hydrolase
MNEFSKVFIRVDGNSEIGLGHLFRCISLAQILQIKYDIHFYCKQIPKSIKFNILQLGFNVFEIKSETEFISKIKCSIIVVLDGYKFTSLYQKKIKEKKVKLVYIDDLCNMYYYADLIINHAPGIDKSKYKTEYYTKFALGLEFTLLRPSFYNIVQSKKKNRKQNTLIISFGGSDYQNITYKSLLTINKLSFSFSSIDIIVGHSYLHLDELNSLINTLKLNVFIHNSLNEAEMCEIFQKNEYALVPSSGVLFEALACGCKPIAGYYINNQIGIYEGFKKMNCIIPVKDFNENTLINGFNKIYDFDFISVIDGMSPNRIIQKIDEL